jgi:hypothetical protein
MSTMTIVVLIGGYLGFVGFVLALMTVAKRSDEAAERHARAIAPRRDQLRHPQGAGRDAEFADAEFLERLDRRAAREFESRRFVRDRNPATKRAPRGR